MTIYLNVRVEVPCRKPVLLQTQNKNVCHAGELSTSYFCRWVQYRFMSGSILFVPRHYTKFVTAPAGTCCCTKALPPDHEPSPRTRQKCYTSKCQCKYLPDDLKDPPLRKKKESQNGSPRRVIWLSITQLSLELQTWLWRKKTDSPPQKRADFQITLQESHFGSLFFLSVHYFKMYWAKRIRK